MPCRRERVWKTRLNREMPGVERTRSGFGLGMEPAGERVDDRHGLRSNGVAEANEINDFQPQFSRFDFGDIRLLAFQLGSNGLLAVPGRLPGLL